MKPKKLKAPKKPTGEEKLLIAIYGSLRRARAWQKAQQEAKIGETAPPRLKAGIPDFLLVEKARLEAKIGETAPPRLPKAKPIPETAIHMNVAALLHLTLPPRIQWWHTPNGEVRSARTGAKLKRMGVKAGIPDFLLYDTQSGYLYCIEVKTKVGALSAQQKAWKAQFDRSPTGRYAVVRSTEEANQVIAEWGLRK
jgi:hypothetical protein